MKLLFHIINGIHETSNFWIGFSPQFLQTPTWPKTNRIWFNNLTTLHDSHVNL